MRKKVGHIVVEYNQASGVPTVPLSAEIESLEGARITKIYYDNVAYLSGRGDTYAIGTIYMEEEEEE